MRPAATSSTAHAYRVGLQAAAGTLLGVVLSGPLSVALVNATHPQPPWQGAEVFARHHHPIQMVPYLGGIALVGALVALMASLHAMARDEQKVMTATALVFTAVFASFIFSNYVVQTTYLPQLARAYDAGSAPVVTMFSMANPTSLAWGIEMWGWGFLGIATWLAAAVFGASRLERATALAFVSNGPVSILGALLTIVRPGWVMTSAGLVAFALWNILLTLMAGLAFAALRERLRGAVRVAAEHEPSAPVASPRV